MKIVLITTGGTIDGADVDTGAIRPTSALTTFLRSRSDVQIEPHILCNKDSREISNSDRQSLLECVLGAASDKILIGHGTFTMCETGRFLKSHLPDTSKCVLLVGARIPFGDPNSDAPAQVLSALKFLQQCSGGVFIAMDGKLWNPDITDKQLTDNGNWGFVERGT